MLTEQEYNDLKGKTRAHIFTHEGKAYDPNGIVESSADMLTNEQTSAIEQYEFMTLKPSAITAYVNESRVTTWIGDNLGTIIYTHKTAHRNKYARKNIVTVLGLNGILYHGLSEGNNMYVNLRAYADQAKANRDHYWNLH